jgi:hypothetical protein
MDQFARQIEIGGGVGGVVEIGSVSLNSVGLFAAAISSAVPMDDTNSFGDLLSAIDAASTRSGQRRAQHVEQQRR